MSLPLLRLLNFLKLFGDFLWYILEQQSSHILQEEEISKVILLYSLNNLDEISHKQVRAIFHYELHFRIIYHVQMWKPGSSFKVNTVLFKPGKLHVRRSFTFVPPELLEHMWALWTVKKKAVPWLAE